MSGNLLPPLEPSPGAPYMGGTALTTPDPLAGRLGPASTEDEGSLPMHRIFAALKRYKWLIMVIVSVGTVAGFFLTRVTDPMYFTEAKIDRLRQAGYTKPTTRLEDGVATYVRDFLEAADPYR